MTAFRLSASCLAVLACLAAPCRAADPAPAPTAPLAADGIALRGPGTATILAAATLAAMPMVQVTVPPARRFEGPLLWTVLVQSGAVDPARFHGDVRGIVTLTGQDGYTAVLALGELSPEFEGKAVILAVRAEGQALEAGHFRIVVPGDKRGGRGVQDLASIGLTAPAR